MIRGTIQRRPKFTRKWLQGFLSPNRFSLRRPVGRRKSVIDNGKVASLLEVTPGRERFRAVISPCHRHLAEKKAELRIAMGIPNREGCETFSGTFIVIKHAVKKGLAHFPSGMIDTCQRLDRCVFGSLKMRAWGDRKPWCQAEVGRRE
jgi:hypothetical protein